MNDVALREEQVAVIKRIRVTAARHAEVVAELVDLLGEARRIKAAEAHGYASLFAFCRDELGLTRDQAYRYLACADVAERQPQVVDALRAGRVNATGVATLAGYVKASTSSDGARVLQEAEGKTVDAIEQKLAELQPKPDVRLRLKPLAAEVAPNEAMADSAPFFAPPAATTRAVAKPLSPQSYKLTMTLSVEAYNELMELRDLASHSVPSGQLDQAIEHAIHVALQQVRKTKCKTLKNAAVQEAEVEDCLVDLVDQTVAPKQPSDSTLMASRRTVTHQEAAPPAPNRYIPADVRRAVWARDGGQCAYIGLGNRRCASTWQLEVDHIIRVADGGASTVANTRLCCRVHNQSREGSARDHLQTPVDT